MIPPNFVSVIPLKIELPTFVSASATRSTLVAFTDTEKEYTRWLQNSTAIPTACRKQTTKKQLFLPIIFYAENISTFV